MRENFNILINGIGGQGALTLKRILAYSAIIEKKHFVTSELHGLAQKGGSVNVHFRLGKKVFSPLVEIKKADLIIGLDLLEATRSVNYASSNTTFLVNDYFNPFYQLSKFEAKDFLKGVKSTTKKIYLLPAAKITQEKLGSSIYEGVFLLGYGIKHNLLPFKEESLKGGIKKALPDSILPKNLKAFELGLTYGEK